MYYTINICVEMQIAADRGSIQSFCITNGWMRFKHQNDEVTSVTHIEDLERHFLEDDLCDISDDGDYVN